MKVIRKIFLASVLTCVSLTISAQTWTQTSAPITNWQAIASSGDGTKLVAAAGCIMRCPGPIFLSTNSGASWVQSSAPIIDWVRVTSSYDGSKLVAASSNIFYSTNSGVAWAQASSGQFTNRLWYSLSSSADGMRVAASEVDAFFPKPLALCISTNYGVDWGAVGVNSSVVAISADGIKMAALNESFALLSTNGAASWSSNFVANVHNWGVMASSANGVRLAGAMDGTLSYTGPIYVSTNSGGTWQAKSWPILFCSSIACSADGTKLVATAVNGGIYTSTNFGSTWISNSAPVADWRSVAISADGSKLVAAAFGGGIWTAQTLASPSMSIKAATSNIVISWLKPSTDFVLQQNTDLTTTNWTAVTNAPVFNFTNLQNQVTLPIFASNAFYRLRIP